MKKTLLITALLLLQIGAFPQTKTPFLNTYYSKENITSIKDQVQGMIDTSYHFINLEYSYAGGQSFAYFSKANHDKLTVEVVRGTVATVDNVTITAPYDDAFKVYKAMFEPTATSSAIKAKGHADPILRNEDGHKTAIAFSRNIRHGYWDIWIRETTM